MESFGSDYYNCHYLFAESIRILIKKLERTRAAVKNNGERDYLRIIDANNFYLLERDIPGNILTDGIINVQKSLENH